MNEQMILEAIQEGLTNELENELKPTDKFDLRTFEEAGVLTRNKGLVVEVNGKKFQITIVAA